MDDEHQPKENDRKNDCLSPPEPSHIAPQKSKQEKYFKYLEPFRLQGVGLDEAKIVFEFIPKIVHLVSKTCIGVEIHNPIFDAQCSIT